MWKLPWENLKKCHSFNAKWDAQEEKETDVNIAVRIVSDAFLDKFDVAYVFSADTDLIPAMKCIRETKDKGFPEKEVVAIFPPGN